MQKLRQLLKPFLKPILLRILRFSVPVNVITKPLYRILYGAHVLFVNGLGWFLKACYFEPLFRSRCERVGKGLWMEQLPYIVGSGSIVIGDSVRISGKPGIGFSTKVHDNPVLIIGDNTFIGHGTSFAVAERVEVGANCYLASGVTIADNDGHPLSWVKRRQNMPPDVSEVRPVKIGNDVWIGRRASVLKGVSIGDRSIVGADAVVTKNVPSDTVVAGNPARAVKTLDTEDLTPTCPPRSPLLSRL
jgi:acetyltransferase-like isoleucine patch superfamily enzyme